jgi:hypothetical protein
MKKILGLVTALIFIAACDDGDIDFTTFDFSQETVIPCTENNNIYMKINEAEVLILEIAPETLVNQVTEVDGVEVPRIIQITGSTKLTYRRYDSVVTSNALCNPSPSTPRIAEEWTGEGELLVTTREIRDDETGVLTGYSHNIVIGNATLSHGTTSQTINNSEFGVIERNFDFTFDFLPAEGDEPTVDDCSGGDNENNLLYTIKAVEALVFDHEDNLFVSAPGTITRELGGFQNPNTFALRIYSAGVSSPSICNLDQPITPVVISKWSAIEGTVKIVTTAGDLEGTWEHRIYLIDAVFQNGTDTFNLNDIADFNEEVGYLFGLYSTAG